MSEKRVPTLKQLGRRLNRAGLDVATARRQIEQATNNFQTAWSLYGLAKADYFIGIARADAAKLSHERKAVAR